MRGSAMLGNCCVGSSSTATAPAMVMRMAMTMATIGRLMKNFDMSVAPGCRLRCRGSPRLGNHRNASRLHQLRRRRRELLHLLHSFYDHALARLQAFGDNPVRPHTLAHLYWTERRLVLRGK